MLFEISFFCCDNENDISKTRATPQSTIAVTPFAAVYQKKLIFGKKNIDNTFSAFMIEVNALNP